jgi:CHASE1-domain containing sensor protein
MSVAVLVLAVGTVASILGTNAIIHSAQARSNKSFIASSDQIAATLKLAIQHEKDLLTSTESFLLGNPTATEAQFITWADTMHVMQRYPELLGFGSNRIVYASEVESFSTQETSSYRHPLSSLLRVAVLSTA